MKLDRKPREGNKSYWGRNKKTHMTRKQKGGADGRRSRWEEEPMGGGGEEDGGKKNNQIV